MEFNLSNYKIRISESLNSIHFYIYAKEGLLLDTYSIDKDKLEDAKGINNIKIKELPTLKNIKKI
jgi:hypothetical protein